MQRIVAWLLGLEDATAVGNVELSLSAAWAQGAGFWLFLLASVFIVGAILFYTLLQSRGGLGWRIALGASRGLLLTMLLLTLAKPVMHATVDSEKKPFLYFVFDGTDSMAIEDQIGDDERAKLQSAVGLEAPGPIARVSYVKALLEDDEDGVLRKFADEDRCRVAAFIFDGNTTSHVRRLELNPNNDDAVDLSGKHLAQQLTTAGQVTAIGTVLDDVSRQHGTSNLAGIVLVSDFANNSGSAPLGKRRGRDQSPASKLGVPIYTVGVGATQARDLGIELQTDLRVKRAERSTINVKLVQSGLQDESATVTVRARRLQGLSGDSGADEFVVGRQTVTLASPIEFASFPFIPEDAGRFELVAQVDELVGEIDDANNRATKNINVIDDYLRLMYVAHEPTWEWRFVKEVFHRDKLVGMEGFRTYLASSDPRVRESNILFLPTLTPKRSDFFKNDVIFLGDMPQEGLSPRFCDMAKEFVGKFGGGLVVIAGPRFGPQQMAGTPLADMLPVIIDPDAQMRDDRPFQLRLAGMASDSTNYPYMSLGDNEAENAQAWNNLGRMQWYQPVANKHDLAVVLAEHPRDTCQDGKTRQPLIAVRQYGKGKVVYLGFNEMWRLRRRHGERYYRQFWSQMIYDLAMSNALGSEKRFVVRTARQEYRIEEKVVLTIDAYDENFQPLGEDSLPGGTISAELFLPERAGGTDNRRKINIPALRQGVFETRFPVYAEGEYRVRVQDPVSGHFTERRFEVTSAPAERLSGVRNIRLQEDLAAETSGKSYDLTTVANLPDDIQFDPVVETEPRNFPLWSTWFWFAAIVTLMLGEWLGRKLINLR